MPKLKIFKSTPIEQTLRNRIRKGSVAERFPQLVKEWHHANFFAPELFGAFSGERVAWTCQLGHVYLRSVARTTQSALRHRSEAEVALPNCPVCCKRIPLYTDSLEGKYPSIAAEWHEFLNGSKLPREVFTDSNAQSFWRCSKCQHTYAMPVKWRTLPANSQGCPKCSVEPKITDSEAVALSRTFQLASVNHGFELESLPLSWLVFWICIAKHHLIYESVEHLELLSWRCALCESERTKRYLSEYPDLSQQLLSVEGGCISPSSLPAGSQKMGLWQCRKIAEHVWSATIANRALHCAGCPFCANRAVCKENSLANFPELIKELHPSKNGHLKASEIISSSRQLVWWKCTLCAHEWERAVYLRTQRSSKCPRCKHKAIKARQIIIDAILNDRVNGNRRAMTG
jgi:hypothetical protein